MPDFATCMPDAGLLALRLLLVEPLLSEPLQTVIQKEVGEEFPFVFFLEVKAVPDGHESMVRIFRDLNYGPYLSVGCDTGLFLKLMLMKLLDDVGWERRRLSSPRTN
jgi:hypothetical protein